MTAEVRPDTNIPSSCILPLLGFLSLSEGFYATESPSYPGFFTLQILLFSRGNFDFNTTALPVLMSTLIPTHPLKSRCLALGVFHRFIVRCSSQMKNVPNKHLNNLLQAVSDPFQFPDLPLQDTQLVVLANHDPMMTAILLIEFALIRAHHWVARRASG